ncbi:MAG: T9SS type A sorting domain-containing protein [Bacteroidales bacterium]|nr:T9SS type A sorting domain-containing protein [Bacteroidales bacterium]
MKKILLLAIALTSTMTMFAQTSLTLMFKGRDQHNARVQLDNVTIQNVTRGWTEAIFFPDTVYTLTVGTGVADYLLHNGMQVMPNPFEGKTQVNIRSAKREKTTITVVDINGKQCAEYCGTLSDGDNYFEIQLTTPQTYILSVQTSDGTRSLKMVNVGNAGNNQIKEVGINGNAIQLKSTTSHIFELGDEMCYTGYSQQSNGLIPSTPITQNQYANEVITLFFVLENEVELPLVATVAASNIGINTATAGGNVFSDGGAAVTAKGVCYSVTPNPTLLENHTTDGTGTGPFTSNLSNLVENTTYYVRAYATNSVGTAYGNEVSFTTEAGSSAGQPCPGTPTVTDYDGNVYNTVQIGAQCWMKENLRTTHYANGDPVPAGNTESATIPCHYMPNNSVSSVTSYGYLYNWPAVMHGYNSSSTNPSGVQGVCPTGWHVPSNAEWDQLINYVNSQSEFLCGGYNNNIAKALASNVGWNYHYENNPCAVCNDLTQNNATGFSAMPAGYNYGDFYDDFGDMAVFSSSTLYDDNNINLYGFSYDDTEMYGDYDELDLGFSVRCVRGEGSTTQIPKVITADLTNNNDGTATGGGYVINSGASAVTARGLCYGTSPNPTLFGSHTTDGSGIGAFTSLLTSLVENTTYYVRAYATNSSGTGYGNEVTFSITPTLNDGVTVTFNDTTWQAGYINGIWYDDYGIWRVYASQTQSQFPTADIATSLTSGTSTATADNQNGGLSGSINWVEYYDQYVLQDGDGNNYGDWWAKNVTCTVSAFDATTLTLTANVNATMFSAYDAFINGTGVNTASTAPMTVDIVNVTLGNSNGGGESTTTVPTVTTGSVSNVTSTTAKCRGTVTSDGGAAVTECGICWDTNADPTISGNHIAASNTYGTFTINVTGLTPGTTYYVRAYATNSEGTAYGSTETFTTSTTPVTTSQWIDYAATLNDYYGIENTIYAVRIAVDTNGLSYYSDGSTSHGTFCGFSQTYDFTHSIWSDFAEYNYFYNYYDNVIDINPTNSYNIDSVNIMGHYNRGASVPASNVDTLIVAILTTLTDSNLVTLSTNNGQIPIVRYYGVPYDVNTHVSLGASIYKLPLTAADCAATTEDGNLFAASYTVPIHLNNITGKIINVAYTFKRGYTIPVNDNILNHSYFYGWIVKDPRSDYHPYNNYSGWFTPDDDIFYNPNQGAIITKYNLNQTNPSSWNNQYFYPAPIWNANIHYPLIYTKISCNDCAY